jgi:hypothetical protein
MQTLKEIMRNKISTALDQNKMHFKDDIIKEVLDSTDFTQEQIENSYNIEYERFVDAYCS